MSLLVLGPAERAEIAKVKAYAEAHVLDMPTLAAASEGFDPEDPSTRTDDTVIRDFGFKCVLPHEISVVFTMEEQPEGLMRHLSVALMVGGNLPNPHVVRMLMSAFGFQGVVADYAYLETFQPGHTAINVLELVEAMQ